MVRYALYPSPFGMLQIGCEDETVVSISSSVSCGTHDPPLSQSAPMRSCRNTFSASEAALIFR